LKGWGEEIQKGLKAPTAFVAGAGSLGSQVSIYLAAVDAGNIRICDFDSVDPTNLNPQLLHDDKRISMN
jgi:adenylyltransferase/sulfurtransferase